MKNLQRKVRKKGKEINIQKFHNSLSKKYRKVLIFWEDFYEETLAKKAFDKWNKAGRPKGTTLEEMEEKIKSIRCCNKNK